MSNFDYVNKHNARYEAGKESYNLEMNLFADLTSQEFAAKYLMTEMNGQSDAQPKVTKKCNGAQAPDSNLPDSVDWSAKGIFFIIFRSRNSNQKPRTMWFMLGFLYNRIT